MDSSNNQAELIQMKRSLLETTSSQGWAYVMKFAETVVRDLEKKALNEEDDAKSNGYRRDARGARMFMDDLFKRIAITKQIDEPTTDDTFLEIVCD